MMSTRIVSRTASCLAVAAALIVGPAYAVEVRQGDTTARYHAELVRAFVPCLSPNDTSLGGIPACSPPVTSSCPFSGGVVDIDGAVEAPPTVIATVDGLSYSRPPSCPSGPYLLAITVRTTGTPKAAPGDGNPVPACTSGECTYEDAVVQIPLTTAFNGTTGALTNLDLIDPNYEIVDVTVFGTDGLPLATAGARSVPSISSLTVPYDACTTPDPDGSGSACSRQPWNAVCDFNVGSIEWSQKSKFYPPVAHVTLGELAGASPLCTTGTYHVEAVVRGTLKSCPDAPFEFHRCTLVDQPVSLPVVANGRDLDDTAALGLGTAYTDQFDFVQISALRVLDATGQPIAASGVTSVRNLVAPRVAIKDDQIRIRATVPIERPFPTVDVVLDPGLEAGMTLSLTDRNGLVYTVTIPGMLWQLQPPIGSRWTYVDKGGVIAGVRKARIKRLGKAGAATGYEVDLQARGVDFAAADFPGMDVRIAIARPDSDQPQRAQRSRTCRVMGTKLTCK
jgi:hypothetical protein